MRCLLLLTLLVSITHCARILAVLPFHSHSHRIMHYSLFRLLTERGHQVVAYSFIPPITPIGNLTYINLPFGRTGASGNKTFEEFQRGCVANNLYGFAMKDLWKMGTRYCELLFNDKSIKELLQSNEKFDMVFIEATFGQEALLVFGHKFKAPVVNFQGFGTWSLINWVVGNSMSLSHIPERVSFPFTNQMTFTERVRNFISTALTLFLYHFDHLPRHQALVRQHYKDPSAPTLEYMLRDISLTLLNEYKTVEYPHPYTPNMVPIAGAHMSSHKTPLPEKIKNFLDKAKGGFIFFSLGTVVPAHILPERYIQAFAQAFGKLSLKVLWKIDIEEVAGLPDNVLLTKWVPQPTVLAHPRCTLFITHGGMFSQHEALHEGVPVVAIPFFADQLYNVRFYEHLGTGVKLELNTVTEKSVLEAINTVISDKRYRDNAAKISRIIRDEPMSGADSAVYWMEYVLRHQGAQHLRPASASLRWYQIFLLDILAVLIATILFAMCIMYIVIKKSSEILLGSKVIKEHRVKKIN